MNDVRKKRLESAGFRVGSVAEFLGLEQGEEKYVNIKASLVMEVFTRRKKCHLTQVDLARRAGTSQSRIAKLEAGDPSVSLDLLVRVLIVLDTPEKLITATLLGRKARA
ncbi:MAG: helix-turn-helix domain-containing protein [Candidatus Kapabacteria bacterium]|nr:helix-turn-helix domain-containing protein [Candidatus Kapabacteria bacterium]